MQRLVVEAEQIQGQTLSLTKNQQHYLKRVLRLREGDRFLALNGQGELWLATLTLMGQQATLSSPAETVSSEQDLSGQKPWITLAACLPKQGFDEVVRQVTELGVDHIVPIISDRTLLRPRLNKLQRWQRIAAEAAEQSERLTVPDLREPISWPEWLAEETNSHRYLCVARHATPSLLTICLSTDIERVVVAIGPEGGWTDAEIEQAIAAGYQPVTLGRRILRAVTAAVAALTILQARFEFASMDPY
ncbi:MAG: 16S rRNA (uracil(1498)-N(3))-methyltransferase [Leptolyngbya sp. SIO1E4]|nr:16S rRNA (uracil(1498)-N(3))-methyltransferase [Leptolyngbya sp. SIO1E4]